MKTVGDKITSFAVTGVKPGQPEDAFYTITDQSFEGKWKVIWGRDAEHSVLLNQYDVCSVPPYVPRRFECVEPAPGQTEGLLQSIQPGNEPSVEWI